VGVFYEDGGSPTSTLDPQNYIVRKDTLVGEIQLLTDLRWPSPIARHPRAVWIEYRAGYQEYPPKLKRLVKILAAHYMENPEATITDRSQSMVSRKVEYGVEDLRSALRVPVAQDDWRD
jgi:hypothetical protein